MDKNEKVRPIFFTATVCPGSSYPNLYNESLYKMGHYLLDIWYKRQIMRQNTYCTSKKY